MRKLRIGYISGHRAYGYGMQLAYGARNAVVEQGHTFIKIADQSEYHSKGNAFDYFKVAFNIAEKMDLDAYIVPAGMIYQFCMQQSDKFSKEELDEIAGRSINLIRNMDPARTLVIERTFEGYRSIDKDNESGMHEAIRHLIEDCGHRKIAFISGPPYSNSAKIREGVYFKEMADHGLETPERLFTRGTYNGKCDDVVERLLDANDDIEAIACACDEIALAVYRVMKKRGLQPGTDIAVVGYDDISEAVHAAPPLSTVHATGYDLGYMAGYEAVRLATGKPQKDFVLKSAFINRGSCGQVELGVEEFFEDVLKQADWDAKALAGRFAQVTYSSAEGSLSDYFQKKMQSFCEKIVENYNIHRKEPQNYLHLVTNQMVREIINDPVTQPYLSVSGFQTGLDAFIRALRRTVEEREKVWVADQAAHAHLQITKLFYDRHSFDISKLAEMEMDTIQIVDDALSEENRKQTFGRILLDISNLGVQYAKVCIARDGVAYTGKEKIVLPERIYVKGSLENDTINCEEGDRPQLIRSLFEEYGKQDNPHSVLTVCALIAAGDVMGFVILEGDSLDFEQQLAIVLLVSYAVKHMMMLDYQLAMVQLLQENNVALTHQSQQDELTGLLNRRGFMLSTAAILNRHYGKNAAVFYLDLDGLKAINDTYGHEIGDDAIINTAKILSSCFRSTDYLARQGGDEFVAFALIEHPEGVNFIEKRVQEMMTRFNEENDVVYTLSISIGYKVFVIDRNSAENFESLMSEADAMLYEVKRKKKGDRFEAEKMR